MFCLPFTLHPHTQQQACTSPNTLSQHSPNTSSNTTDMSSLKITLVCVLDKHPLAEAVEFDVSEDSTGRDLKKEIRARMAHIIDSNLTAKQLVVWSTEIDPDTNDKEVPVSAKTHRSFARRERLYLLWPSRPAIEKVRSKWIIKDILPKDKKTVMIITPKPGRQRTFCV